MNTVREAACDWHGGMPQCVEIRECLDILGEVFTTELPASSLSTQFARLGCVIQQRFSAECEYYDDIVVRSPWIAAQVKLLRDRHRRIQDQLTQLHRSSADPSADVCEAANELAQQLLEHEQAENLLRQEVSSHCHWGLATLDIPGE